MNCIPQLDPVLAMEHLSSLYDTYLGLFESPDKIEELLRMQVNLASKEVASHGIYGPPTYDLVSGFRPLLEWRRHRVRVTPDWNISRMTKEVLFLLRKGFVLRFDMSDMGTATVGDYDRAQLEAIPALMKHYVKPWLWFKTKSAKFQQNVADMLFGPPS